MTVRERIAAHVANLGSGMQVRRAVPTPARRLVGAWCFLDHFGPATVAGTPGLRVGPHPHTGLQTATWVLSGEILHRDSLGSLQTIVPGQLNLMTAGRGIAHSEESPAPRSPQLHGVQFWIALPEAARHGAPAFAHHPELPAVERGGARITVLVGSALGATSPAQVYSPLVGLDVALPRGTALSLPLQADFEHGILVTDGAASVDGAPLAPGTLEVLPQGTGTVALGAPQGARLVIVGGVPFPEPVLMWWNFVGRTRAELTQACRDWNAGDARFGNVAGYDGPPLVAPLPPWSDGVVNYP